MTKYEELLNNHSLHLKNDEISKKTAAITSRFQENNTPEVLKFIYSCFDLTSLNKEDNAESIWKLVEGVNNFDGSKLDINNVAAICVFPNLVGTLKEALTADVKIASVAGGFPASQTFIEVKIAETALAVADGADEIHITLNSGLFFEQNYEEIVTEIQELKDTCRDAVLKIILDAEVLKTLQNIKKAAILSTYSGADFVEILVNANPDVVYVVCLAISEYYQLHDRKIGIKIFGKEQSMEDILKYYTLLKEVLGEEWLSPDYFRIGATASLTSMILNDNLL
ncbi:deoxyribose-phosphate aldolase [Bacteroidia bacterium]|nr:deoxyribose-phosphate aldolase [Bacteroidia bacterium]